MAEKIQFDILANDRASAGFRAAGKAASAASDDVLGLARRLDDVGRKNAQARVGLAGDKDALAQLDKLDAKMLTTGRRVISPNIDVHGAAKASAEISAIDAELDHLIAKSGEAEVAVGGESGLSGPNGMGALIGAGVALAPILTTVAVGTGAFGAAAYGSLSPIFKAAQATGGLQANLSKLDPEQRTAAKSLLGLGQQFSAFSADVEPQVMTDFGDATRVASDALTTVAPLAKIAGREFGGLLGQIDTWVQGPRAQQFAGWMEHTIGPDFQMLGHFIGSVADDLPLLLEHLQGAGMGLLETATGAFRLLGDLEKLHLELPLLGAAIGFMVGGPLGALVGAAAGSVSELSALGKKTSEVKTAFVQTSAGAVQVTGAVARFGPAAGTATRNMTDVGNAARNKAAPALVLVGDQAESAKTQVQLLTGALGALNKVLSNQSAEIAWKEGQLAARKAIEGGTAALEGNTQKALANRQQVVSNTQQLVGMIQNEEKTGTSVRKMSGQLESQIRLLQSSGDKSDWVTAQLRLLKKAQDALHSVKVAITVTADGSWAIQQGGGRRVTNGPPEGAARGMFITSGRPGVDDQLILAQRDELIVPPPIVKSGAVDHLRGLIPGFAQGGIVGSIRTGTPSRLGPWEQRDYAATQQLLEAATAKAAAKALTSFTGVGTGGSGVTRWAPVILNALGLLGQSAGNLGPVEHRMAQESGGNPTIVNRTDSNWLAGTPSVGLMQVIGPTFASNAGPFRNVGPFEYGTSVNPLANTYAGLHHALTAYPGRSLSSVMLQPGGYDRGGYLPRGLSLAYNGTGRPERIPDPTKPEPRSGPLVQINGMVVREQADLAILAQKLSFAVTASGF